MGKSSRKKQSQKPGSPLPPVSPPPAEKKRPPLWQGIILSLLSVVLFLGLLEGVLALFGVNPALQNDDPFVGFVSNVPLFVEQHDAEGRAIMATAPNKRGYFNTQQFPVAKAAGTKRIFCLGGSTTYGRPYNDTTSFAGWLRELLPEADPGKNWEVINAGGISYASYRVAQLMQELVRYQPDLFIIYTGHNEFLEERSYGKLRDIPGPIKKTAALLSQTRTWGAMSAVMDRIGVLPHQRKPQRVQLAAEVNALLDQSMGPQMYHRDETLRDQILRHYRISLERMADMAREAGAEVVFVTPASNLRDCSPFKSEHSTGLNQPAAQRSEALLAEARDLIRQSDWSQASALLQQALAMDPQYAELYYQEGRNLLALGRLAEADTALRRARDEDVCPLRALSAMRGIVTEVAREKDAILVDFIDLLGQRVMAAQGYRSPGDDYFLDHVHPTIEGNRLLAVALVSSLSKSGMVHPVDTWGQEMINRVAVRVEAKLDKKEHVRALLNLALVENWAGKEEDASRLVNRVLASGIEDEDMLIDATAIAAPHLLRKGDFEGAERSYRQALSHVPASGDLHLLLALMYLKTPSPEWEQAGAHALLATVLLPRNDVGFLAFGDAMASRQRYDLAFQSVEQALRISPQSQQAKTRMARLSRAVDPQSQRLGTAGLRLEKYDSGAPRLLVQERPDKTGRPVADGILTEWYKNGMLKRFVDYKSGVQDGMELHWNPNGTIAQRRQFKHGTPINSN